MIPYVKGRVTRQAHVELPAGTCEEEYARSGFSGRYAHLYRSAPPVGWSRLEGPLRPRAFDLARRPEAQPAPGEDYLAARTLYLSNDDCRISFANVTTAMSWYFRNADADELLFIHAGSGTLETDFGPIGYRGGDYLVVPRGTVHRLVPAAPTALLAIETRGELRFPERGMLGQHALFDPAVVEVPSPEAGPASTLGPSARGEWELRIRARGETTRVFYPFCPLNTVGWKGTLAVQRLNVADIRPVSCDRYHLPPSAHTTFVTDGVVICSFLPRPLETGDPHAMKVPFFHSNIDFDEVLFYHAGEFFSRSDIQPGMLTFHPAGIHHGPQPGAELRAKAATHTSEVAVMIDTRRPLRIADSARPVEIADYWRSWSAK